MSNDNTNVTSSRSWSRETEYIPVTISNGKTYLESPRIDRIPAELKQIIVNKYAETGNLSLACKLNNVDARLMRTHYNIDPEFKKAIDEAREQICDKAEGHIVEYMGNRGNVVDRLAWLRAHRPSVWNPQPNAQPSVSNEVVIRLTNKASEYIDAEVVKKESLEEKR